MENNEFKKQELLLKIKDYEEKIAELISYNPDIIKYENYVNAVSNLPIPDNEIRVEMYQQVYLLGIKVHGLNKVIKYRDMIKSSQVAINYLKNEENKRFR